MEDELRIVSVTEENIDREGFFCMKSRKTAEGYLHKKEWLVERFREGMKLHILYNGKRSFAFIEYLPGEYAWRAVYAEGYMFIHCLWSVGKGQKHGYASTLLEMCEKDARDVGMNGIAVLTSAKPWLVDAPFFINKGYSVAVEAEPAFKLLVKKFKDAPDPSLPTNWGERINSHGEGLSVVHACQCPFVPDAIGHIRTGAEELSIPSRAVELNSPAEIRDKAPSPYGVFGTVYNGRLLSYHYLLKKDMIKLIST